MKLILILIALVAAVISVQVSPSTLDEAWTKFKLDHGKQYKTLVDESERKTTFSKNFNKIEEHNKLYDQGLVKYYLKINQYADFTPDEMTSASGFTRSSDVDDLIFSTFIPGDNLEVPDEIDWREKGAVTEVKNQTRCRSSWAFSAAGALEAQHFIKTGDLVALSEQNLMDCSRSYSTKGCKGGDYVRAFIYVHENDGINSEESYPYEAVDKKDCFYKDEFNITSTPGLLMIEEGNEAHLKAAVGTAGPVCVGIDRDPDEFVFYGGGIFHNEKCMATLADHSLLVVGYGTEDGEDYWLAKNSFGVSWGEEGYIRIARTDDKNCGIANYAAFPLHY